MCFSQEMSFGFAAFGFLMACVSYFYTKNTRMAVGVFWFFLMEFLQGLQYYVIDDCANPWNKFFTLLGLIHICYQPYFTHILNSALTKNPKYLAQYDVVLRLCLVGGTMLLARHFLTYYPGWAPL